MIDLDLTFSNESGRSTVCRLGISIQYSVIQYQTRKSNFVRLIETISIRNDRRQIRKIYYQFIHINITFHFQWRIVIVIPSTNSIKTKFDGIQMWKIYLLSIIIQILDIIVDKERQNVLLPNIMEFKWGRSIHYQ